MKKLKVYGGSKMQLVLNLNARFQPKHRFELEDALQEIIGGKYGRIDINDEYWQRNGEKANFYWH
jgi:hypothetical protein